jgi:hypothetical protein
MPPIGILILTKTTPEEHRLLPTCSTKCSNGMSIRPLAVAGLLPMTWGELQMELQLHSDNFPFRCQGVPKKMVRESLFDSQSSDNC